MMASAASIIASETTAELAGDRFIWRELDTVRVKGRTRALKIFELLALAEQKSPLPDTVMTDYAEGLAQWRAGMFDSAAKCFARSADTDRPSANFLLRAREMENQKPGTDWDPVRALQEK